jgi:hypothetical protein
MAGHNNVERHAKDYLKRIREFIEHIDLNQQSRLFSMGLQDFENMKLEQS